GLRQLATLVAGSPVGVAAGLRRSEGAAFLVIVAALVIIITFVPVAGFGVSTVFVPSGLSLPNAFLVCLCFRFDCAVLINVLHVGRIYGYLGQSFSQQGLLYGLSALVHIGQKAPVLVTFLHVQLQLYR